VGFEEIFGLLGLRRRDDDDDDDDDVVVGIEFFWIIFFTLCFWCFVFVDFRAARYSGYYSSIF
jgi:hypothetical protein